MSSIPLQYGCNPHQEFARLSHVGDPSPLAVLNGQPSYINVLDALTAWQLVRELYTILGKPAAASYKHLSPAGAAIAGDVSAEFARSQLLDAPPSDPSANAYVRARGADRVSSFGDAVAVSHSVGVELATILKREVSDLIIAPSYEPDALEMLRAKKTGRYVVLQIDPSYEPPPVEMREVFGFRLEQQRNDRRIGPDVIPGHDRLPGNVVETLVVASTAVKYTQSNSVCVAWNGQVIGMGAGQQSRIHCTRIACAKAEHWMLQTHPKVLGLRFPPDLSRTARANAVSQYILWDELTDPERAGLCRLLRHEPARLTMRERLAWYRGFEGVCLASDAFIPFRDNIDRAARTGVAYVTHAGGAIRDTSVRAAAREHGITLLETGIRSFLH